jgi:hypothetical protein
MWKPKTAAIMQTYTHEDTVSRVSTTQLTFILQAVFGSERPVRVIEEIKGARP